MMAGRGRTASTPEVRVTRAITGLPRKRGGDRTAPGARPVLVALLLAAAASVARGGDGAPLPVRDLRQSVRADLPEPGLVAYLGVQLESRSDTLRVGRVVAGSAAEFAGVRAGDVLERIGGERLLSDTDFDRALAQRSPGETVALGVRRGFSRLELSARLAGRRPRDGIFRGSRFRLAVVPLRFAGEAAPSLDARVLSESLLARTGRAGRGASLADYFAAQSHGRLTVEGDVLPAVTLPSARTHYGEMPMGAHDGSAFEDAARVLETTVGERTLEGFDGVAFLHGGAHEKRAGFALWPHRSTIALGARRVPYYVHAVPASGPVSIGVHCHEFGHLLGLPDAYGAGHRTGSGDFCLMAIGHRGGPLDGGASPFSVCAWCRVQLGWADPVVLDPRVPQRLRLRPVESARDQVAVVPLNARSDEYLLLESRARIAFDAELPSAGLLVWRVGGRPTPGQGTYGTHVDLVEAHGIDVFDAALVRPEEVAFPTARAQDLTPTTVPHVRPTLRSGFEVHLTSIVREPDGSVVLTLGVPSSPRQSPPAATPRESPDPEGFVVREDPVTGDETRFYVGPLHGVPQPAPPPASSAGQEQR